MALAIWCGIAGPALAHEFWIEPLVYELVADAPVEAELRVGTHFVGPNYMFIPQGYVSAKFVGPQGSRDLEFTGEDSPALTLSPLGRGLHAIVLDSAAQSLIHDDFAAFAKFAKEVGRSDEAAAAERTGAIRESYFRHAKSLIRVGAGSGQDEAHGLTYEWIGLDNPYDAPAGPIRFQLRFNGAPAADQPVQVFARDQGSDSAAEPVALRTDIDGVLTLPETTRGEIMLNSVKLLPAPVGSAADWISHWASITFAR